MLTHPLVAYVVVVADGLVGFVSGWRAPRAVAGAEGLVSTSVVVATFEVVFFWDEIAIAIAAISLGGTETNVKSRNVMHCIDRKNSQRNLRTIRLPDMKLLPFFFQRLPLLVLLCTAL